MQVGELGKVAKCVVLSWQELQERSADSKQLTSDSSSSVCE
jgi:hypothetical protein